MKSPHFKANNLEIFNKHIPLYEIGDIDARSLIGLYLSQILLYTGLSLILLNNLEVILPGSYFGAWNWLTVVIFSIGLAINFVSIPWLYFSSFKDFKKENDFWDKEIFWILPLFFFGTFFLYGSQMKTSFMLFILSIVVIAAVHLVYIYEARKLIQINSKKEIFSNYHQYEMTLKYLTAYYIILLVLLVIYNPLQYVFTLIRMHA
ncbi:MAG: hypothetical protein WCT19_04895 [Candidatus Paceibacterota bacterium]